MKLLKLADLVGQVLMLFTGITLFIIPGNTVTIFPTYYLVGGWQVASMIIHQLTKPGWRNLKERKSYFTFVAWTFGIGTGCYILAWMQIPFLYLYYAILLVVSPFIACWYFYIGITEWQTITRKELIHLKR